MQWNHFNVTQSSPLLKGVDNQWFYFVHSYEEEQSASNQDTIATCDYGAPGIAAVQSGLIFGTQFHPEKSGKAGQVLLKNFISICESSI